jgi:uncharacterized membrane protein
VACSSTATARCRPAGSIIRRAGHSGSHWWLWHWLGWASPGYLSAYQYGLVRSVWDPIFGSASSERILSSSFSRVLPIPDAALGALGYLADAITGAIGGRSRWRSMPWMVILFGVAVGPLGATSLFLVISQPVVFDAWCSLCLASAVISMSIIGPAMDEVLASLQHLGRAHRRGQSLWRTFLGARDAGAGVPIRSMG